MITLRGKQFDFSPLNANDMDRFEDALNEMTRASQEAERRGKEENLRLGDRLREQARIFMRGLDEILGAGASAILGLDENDAAPIYEIIGEMSAAISAEQKCFLPTASPNPVRMLPAPQNRAQRRQQKKHKPHSRPEGSAPALKMVERVDDKAARRAELLRQLKELDNG